MKIESQIHLFLDVGAQQISPGHNAVNMACGCHHRQAGYVLLEYPFDRAIYRFFFGDGNGLTGHNLMRSFLQCCSVSGCFRRCIGKWTDGPQDIPI